MARPSQVIHRLVSPLRVELLEDRTLLSASDPFATLPPVLPPVNATPAQTRAVVSPTEVRSLVRSDSTPLVAAPTPSEQPQTSVAPDRDGSSVTFVHTLPDWT